MNKLMKLLFFLYILLYCGCSHNAGISKTAEDVLINNEIIPRDSLVNDLLGYISYENILQHDSSIIMKYSELELLQIIGEPLSSMTFPLRRYNRSQRVLLTYFSEDSEVMIKEHIWKLDSLYNATFWFKQEGDVWMPVTFDVYGKDAEF